jgi:hypothetical protein
VLFVSHDLATLSKLCTKALWLESGHVRDEGETGTRRARLPVLRGQPGRRPANPAPAEGGLLRSQSSKRPRTTAGPSCARTRLRHHGRLRVGRGAPRLVSASSSSNDRGVRVFDENIATSCQHELPAGPVTRAVLAVPPVLLHGEHHGRRVAADPRSRGSCTTIRPRGTFTPAGGAGPRLDRTGGCSTSRFVRGSGSTRARPGERCRASSLTAVPLPCTDALLRPWTGRPSTCSCCGRTPGPSRTASLPTSVPASGCSTWSRSAGRPGSSSRPASPGSTGRRCHRARTRRSTAGPGRSCSSWCRTSLPGTGCAGPPGA